MSANQSPHLIYFLTTISIVGTIGNLIVAFVYFQKKDKQTSTFFILLLAFIDLTVCCILVPMTIYMESILFETDNIFVCKTFFFLTTTTVPSSNLLMTAIAFDRYFCICKVGRNIMTLSRARILGSILLIVSGCLGVIPALAAVIQTSNRSGNITIDDYNSSIPLCTVDTEIKLQDFGFIMPFKICYDLLFLMSVLIITALYILIYKEIYTRRKIKRDRKRKLFYNSFLNGGGAKALINDGDNNDNKPSFLYRLFFCAKLLKVNNGENNKKSLENIDEDKCIQEKNAKTIPLITLTNNPSQSDDKQQKKHRKVDIEKPLLEDEKEEPSDHKNEINFIKMKELANDLNDNINNNNNQDKNNEANFNNTEKRNSKEERRNSNGAPLIRPQASIMLRRRSLSHGKHAISTKDIRTAFMLFVVSFLFIVFYLPSIIATYLAFFIPLIPNNLYITYLYFSNSAINPIIYCFLNPNFRTDLFKLFLKRGFIFDKCAKRFVVK